MRSFLSRFAKMASLLMMSAALLLSLTVNVFASTDLTSTRLGFYQIKNGPPPTFDRVGSSPGSSGFGISSDQYDQGGMCWIGSRFQFQSADLPVDRDWIQLTIYLGFSAANAIPSEYRNDEFFPNILYLDNSLTSGYESIPYEAMKPLKPIRVSSNIQANGATLNIMLSKDEYLNISTPRSGGRFYHTWIFPQINSNYMISQLAQASDHYVGLVMVVSLRWSDTSDIVPIDEQTLQALAQLQSSIDEGFTAVIDGQNHTNEKLDSIDSAINGNYVDPSDMSGIDSSIGDHSAAEGEVKDALSNIENMTLVDGDGNTIDVSFDGEYFKNLENYFNFQLDGPSVTNSAVIFRKTLTGYIGLFGSFIFFPLVLGILGALLGRPSGA